MDIPPIRRLDILVTRQLVLVFLEGRIPGLADTLSFIGFGASKDIDSMDPVRRLPLCAQPLDPRGASFGAGRQQVWSQDARPLYLILSLFLLTLPPLHLQSCTLLSRFSLFTFHSTLASHGVPNGITQCDDMLNLEHPSPCNRVQ
jgi:hypothetical protein